MCIGAAWTLDKMFESLVEGSSGLSKVPWIALEIGSGAP